MPRQHTPVGSHGAIALTQLENGLWSARRSTSAIWTASAERSPAAGRSRAAAERALKAALADRTAPLNNDLRPATRVQDVAERWFADVQTAVEAGDKSPNTARLHRHYLDRHVLPGVGALRLGEATAARLDDFIAKIRTEAA